MLTKSDIKQLKDIFVTKAEFQREIARLKEVFVTKEEFFDFKDQMITNFDAILHELKGMREEMTINFHRRTENSQQLEKHETRITTLEEKLTF